MLWVLKRMISMRTMSFEQPKQMFKMIDENKLIISLSIILGGPMVDRYMSHGMRFPTMWYVPLAKAQTSLGICAV